MRLDRRGDDGFTLVEVMVAMFVFALVASAALGLTVSTLRAAADSRSRTQAKEVAAQVIESMRQLPFSVESGTSASKDLLDTYFPNLTSPAAAPSCGAADSPNTPASTWSGYVSGGQRCGYEVAAGDFYRTVLAELPGDGSMRFVPVVDVQFLEKLTPPGPVTPTVPYSADSPPTRQVGVTVTVIHGVEGGEQSAVTTYSQIIDRPREESSVSGSAAAKALRAVTNLPGASVDDPIDDIPLAMDVGTVNGRGSSTTFSRAAVNATAVSARTPDTSAEGASLTAEAPPTVGGTSPSGPAGSVLGGFSAGGADFASSSVGNVGATADLAQPGFGVDGGWVTGGIAGGAVDGGVRFGNGTLAPYVADQPLVTFGSTATTTFTPSGCGTLAGGRIAVGAARMQTGADRVETCAAAATGGVTLFGGEVVVEVVQASLTCVVDLGTPSATGSFEVVVHVGADSYILQSGQDNNAVLGDAIGDHPELTEWVASWSSPSDVSTSTGAGEATAELSSALTITSTPTKALSDGSENPATTVSVSVAALSCEAVDRR
jgi:prepilin-type N-terminal cleavage/methylation domain-containing protein